MTDLLYVRERLLYGSPDAQLLEAATGLSAPASALILAICEGDYYESLKLVRRATSINFNLDTTTHDAEAQLCSEVSRLRRGGKWASLREDAPWRG